MHWESDTETAQVGYVHRPATAAVSAAIGEYGAATHLVRLFLHRRTADALPSLHQMRRIQVPILIVEGKTQRALASRDGRRRQDAGRARRADFRLVMTYDASLLFL